MSQDRRLFCWAMSRPRHELVRRALARDQAAQRIAEEGNRARGLFWLSGIDDLRCNTPNAEHDQRFMMLQAATALHQPLIAYQAIFAIAHPCNTAIPEIVSGVRQHSHFRLSAGCMVIRFSQFLTNLESLVAADRFGGKGTSANARNRPGPQRDPTSSGTVDVSMKVFAPWTAMIAHGSHEHAPRQRVQSSPISSLMRR